MSCILKFRSSKISLETLDHSLHRGEKIELAAKHHGIYEIPPFGAKVSKWPSECVSSHFNKLRIYLMFLVTEMVK